MTQGARLVVQVDPDLMDFIPDFLAHRRDDVHALRDALRQSDFDTIRLVGHNLKGCGGGYGFHYITDVGREIEDAAFDRDPAVVARCTAALADYLARVEVV